MNFPTTNSNTRQTDSSQKLDVVLTSGLGKTIDDRRILDDISFRITSGEFVALLGANGAGKSTLLRILSTLLPASQGKLYLFGQSANPGASSIRSRLSMIGHNSMLYRDLSIRENLIFYGRLYGLADPQCRANELLEYVDLLNRADDPVKTFSRGMEQRAAIARALVNDPDLLLADEPFTGLDVASRQIVENLLRQMNDEGRTIILASHDIQQVLQLTQRAFVLRKGRLVLDEPTEHLDTTSTLAEVIAA